MCQGVSARDKWIVLRKQEWRMTFFYSWDPKLWGRCRGYLCEGSVVTHVPPLLQTGALSAFLSVLFLPHAGKERQGTGKQCNLWEEKVTEYREKQNNPHLQSTPEPEY